MKDFPGGSYLVLKSTPIVPGDRTLMAIGYKYNSRKVLGFIDNEGDGIIEPGVVCPHLIGRYFNICNEIDNHNRMSQYYLLRCKYWVTQSDYFILATIVVLCMGKTYGKILFYHVISEVSMDNKIATINYNNSTVYDFFNSTFPDDCGSPDLNPRPITISDTPHLDKRAHDTPDIIPSAISVSSENYVSTLTPLMIHHNSLY